MISNVLQRTISNNKPCCSQFKRGHTRKGTSYALTTHCDVTFNKTSLAERCFLCPDEIDVTVITFWELRISHIIHVLRMQRILSC